MERSENTGDGIWMWWGVMWSLGKKYSTHRHCLKLATVFQFHSGSNQTSSLEAINPYNSNIAYTLCENTKLFIFVLRTQKVGSAEMNQISLIIWKVHFKLKKNYWNSSFSQWHRLLAAVIKTSIQLKATPDSWIFFAQSNFHLSSSKTFKPLFVFYEARFDASITKLSNFM